MNNQANSNKRPALRRIIARAAGLALAAALTLNASALSAERIATPKPLDENLKLQFRNIAVAIPSTSSPTLFDAAEPPNFNAMARQRRARERGGAVVEQMRVAPPHPMFPSEAHAAFLAPFALIAYASGLAQNPSSEEVAELAAYTAREQDHLQTAIAEIAAQDGFARAFAVAAEKQAGRRYRVHFQGASPTAPDAIVENFVETLHLKLLKKDIYAFVMEVRTRVTTPADGRLVYDEVASYQSGAAALADWAFNKGEPLKTQMTRASEQLTARLVRQILPRGVASERQPRERQNRTASEGLFVVHANPLHPRHIPQLGTVGIISTCAIPSITMQLPLTKEAAAAEARENVFEYFAPATPFPILNAAAATLLIPASILAQTHGAVAGLTEHQLDVADRALASAARSSKLQPMVRQGLLAKAAAVTIHPIVEVAKPFPPGEEKEFSQISAVMAGTLAWLPDGQTPAYYLQSQNVQTVLEVQILNPVLNGNGDVNPGMRFCAGVRATLWTVENGLELASCEIRHTSPARTFATWAANDATLLHRELVTFTEGATAAIIQQMAIPAWNPPAPTLASTR